MAVLTSSCIKCGAGNHEVDFVPRGSGAYTYYPNGALKSDENEQIVNITYDTYLNQPLELTLTGSRWIKMSYNGGGDLLKTEYSNGEYWENIHGFVLKNGIQYQLSIPEGRAIWNDTTWEYEFEYKDHLGNTRVSFIVDGDSVLQTAKSDFDPWGVILKSSATNSISNRFEMQGKEIELTFGLNRVNFGARTYNPTIGRWDRVDVFSEKFSSYSGYNYTVNNPTNMIDPDGNFPYPVTIRSFVPVGAFRGTGFHDDGRSFSSRSDVTSRISQSFTVDPTARTFSGGSPTSSPTKWIGGLSLTATDEGSASATFSNNRNGNVASVISEFEGSNPFFGGAAPNIAVSSNLILTENIEKGTLGVSIKLSSKQFPATEATIQDSKKNSIFIGGAAAYGTPGNLVRGEKTPVHSVNLIINIDKNGVFQSVNFQNKTYSIIMIP